MTHTPPMVDSSGHSAAASPLLQTKLYIPRARPGLVPRPRLIERLDQGIDGELTLVSAPAGFGKTTLLAEWLATAQAGTGPAAWVALDQNDNDPTLFWAYFIGALQTVQAQVGTRALSLLQSPQPLPVETLLATLLNEVGAGAIAICRVLVPVPYSDVPATDTFIGNGALLGLRLPVLSDTRPPQPV